MTPYSITTLAICYACKSATVQCRVSFVYVQPKCQTTCYSLNIRCTCISSISYRRSYAVKKKKVIAKTLPSLDVLFISKRNKNKT